MSVKRIVSGGQTGADRGGLDAAFELELPHGGWCPKGRRAEDGPIPARYALTETDSPDYEVRTGRNVVDSDGTVVFAYGPPRGGSALTLALARKHGRPRLRVDLARLDEARAAARLRRFVTESAIEVLNVAGSRESHARGIGEVVRRVVVRALSRRDGDQADLFT